MDNLVNLIYANKSGEILEHPHLKMVARSAGFDFVPGLRELIPLPENSRFYYMPDTYPFAYNEQNNSIEKFTNGYAVSVFLSPGYLRLLLPSYKKQKKFILPFYAYCAVGWSDGKFVVPAIKVDDDSKWNPSLFDYSNNFNNIMNPTLERFNKNRIVKQLAYCALEYHCTAAKNFFYRRWECPIPTSPICNSSCLGCISYQPKGNPEPPQKRINFIPTPEEISEIILFHAEIADEPIISFGQGCEGDPIMVADTIAAAVKIVRAKGLDLTINFNSNCSKPDKLKLLLDAGIDSIRVSLNSIIPKTYNAYFNPAGYAFEDVAKSIELANSYGVYVALNLLTLPGINDKKSEVDAFLDFLSIYKINLIQLRNLNIDPDLLSPQLMGENEGIIGIQNMIKLIRKKNKNIKFGYFNRTKNNFYKDFGLPNLKK